MADLLLADAVDTPEALFEAVGVPRQIVVHHQVGILKVDAFTGGIGGNQHTDFGVRAKERLGLAAVIAVDATVNHDDGVMAAKYTGDFLVQVVQGVAVLAEDDDLAHPPACIVHLGFVLEDAREFVPLAILAGGDEGFGLLFEDLEDD